MYVGWFKAWYGASWNYQLDRAAGFGPNHIANRLCGAVVTDLKTLRRLGDVKASLQINAESPYQGPAPSPLPITGKICYQCQQAKPLKLFAKVKQGDLFFYNRRCNHCRGYRHYNSKGVHEKRALLDEAKRKPCVHCRQTFDLAAMLLVHARDEQVCHLSQWRCLPRVRVAAEIERSDPMCANCAVVRGVRVKRGRPNLANVPPSQPRLDLSPI